MRLEYRAFVTIAGHTEQDIEEIKDALDGGPIAVQLPGGRLREAMVSFDESEPDEVEED